ncbi:MAG: 4Fe-4S binding protein [Sedimentisphaerales bacterium]|nr:4Fe-4S binding protein [Sedimentisphaerales bacterium]
MVMRNIVRIDEEKCNGCGQCVIACAEGAIEIIDGKAKLVSEIYCDGLGACLGTCPEGAITIEQREAADFDKEATKAHLAEQGHAAQPSVPVCPGLVPREIKPGSAAVQSDGSCGGSQLSHWPILLNLVSPTMPCFADADLLLVADCVPFAMGDFHNKILKDHSVAVGCPKFGNVESYIEKVAAILKSNKLKSLSVVHMEVPCCSGLTHIAREAIGRSGVTISFDDITIGINGEICKRETIES